MSDTFISIANHPLFLVALATGAVFFVLQNMPEAGVTIKPIRLDKKRGLNALGWFAVVLFPVWLALLGLTLYTLFHLWSAPPDPTDASNVLANRIHYLAIVGLMTALAGLVGTPLALIRVFTTERTTTATEEGLITDRINKAVEGLGAEKQVDRIGRPVTMHAIGAPAGENIHFIQWQGDTDPEGIEDHNAAFGDWQVFRESMPNLEVRIGAIYAHERIAQDSDRDHIRIMEILCAYIRENSNARQPADFPESDWLPLADDATEEQRKAHAARRQERFGPGVLDSVAKKWAHDLQKPRTDVQVALEVIGRRGPEQIVLERTAELQGSDFGYRLDLRGANLQACSILRLDFANCVLAGGRTLAGRGSRGWTFGRRGSMRQRTSAPRPCGRRGGSPLILAT